jgi:hypothetical protein
MSPIYCAVGNLGKYSGVRRAAAHDARRIPV